MELIQKLGHPLPMYQRWYPYRWYRRKWSPYYFDRLYSDLQIKMNMFKSFLDSIPKNRSDLVNDLEVPEDVLKPHVFHDFEDPFPSVDSILSETTCADDFDAKIGRGLSTDSSISLSRAMTDSEIDYERYRRLKNRSPNPFDDLQLAVEAFPPKYLDSLQCYQTYTPYVETYKRERPLYNPDLHRRMRRYIDEECLAFDPEDPALLDLEEALENIDSKILEDLDSI